MGKHWAALTVPWHPPSDFIKPSRASAHSLPLWSAFCPVTSGTRGLRREAGLGFQGLHQKKCQAVCPSRNERPQDWAQPSEPLASATWPSCPFTQEHTRAEKPEDKAGSFLKRWHLCGHPNDELSPANSFGLASKFTSAHSSPWASFLTGLRWGVQPLSPVPPRMHDIGRYSKPRGPLHQHDAQ